MQTQEMGQSKTAAEGTGYQLLDGVFNRVEALSPRTFATAAALSIGSSLLLRLMGRRDDAIFVGEWASTLLMMGLYTKSVAENRRSSSEAAAGSRPSEKMAH